MRRISLALALVGAIAAAGCGGSSPSQSSSGHKGVGGSAFTVTVRGPQAGVVLSGGVVTSNPAGINCGDANGTCTANFPWGSPVTLTFTPDNSGYYALAGDCGGSGQGVGTCVLNGNGNADDFVDVLFSTTAVAHPNIADHHLHGLEYFKTYVAKTGTLTCTNCHGAQLQGAGLAPSCTTCHPFSVTWDMQSPNMSANGHFDINGQWDMGSGPCARCHTTAGFLDYIGVTNITVNGQAYTFPGNANYLSIPQLTGPANIATTEWLSPVTATLTSGAGLAFQPTVELVTLSPYEDAPGILDPGGVVYQDPMPIVSADGSYMSNLTLKCQTCHNPVADVFTGLNPSAPGLSKVTLSNGSQISTDNATALCAQCHTGNVAGLRNVDNGGTYGMSSRGSLASASWEIEAIASGSTSLWPVAATWDTIISSPANIAALFPQTGGSHGSDGIIPFPHRMIAGSTFFGSASATYYQYPYATYDGPNPHGACTDCHGAHTLQVNVTAQTCGRCHFKAGTNVPVTDLADLSGTRQLGFEDVDVDGNGVVEGLDAEVFGSASALSCASNTCQAKSGLVNVLGAAIQYYASAITGTGVCFTWGDHLALYQAPVTPTDIYSPATCPNNSTAGLTPFYSFTPALVRAVYNFQAIQEDPGAWAHNPRYAIEILFDSIQDLNRGIIQANKTSFVFNGQRTFGGHFGGNDPDAVATVGSGHWGNPRVAESWIPGASAGRFAVVASNTSEVQCAICHYGDTADFFASYATTTIGPVLTPTFTAQPITGFACTTCHQPSPGTFGDPSAPNFKGDLTFTKFYSPATVTFPLESQDSRATIWSPTSLVSNSAGDSVPANSFLASGDIMCMTCHAGRMTGASSGGAAGVGLNTAGTVAINAMVGAAPDAMFASTLSASSVHGYACAATVLGSNAAQAYQYPADAYGHTGTYIGYAGFWVNPVGSPHGARCSGCHDWMSTGHTFVIDYTDTASKGGTVPTGTIGATLAKELGVAANSQNTKACADCHSGPYALGNAQIEVAYLETTVVADIAAYAANPSLSPGHATAAANPMCYFNQTGPHGSKPGSGWYNAAADGFGNCVATPATTATTAPFNSVIMKAYYNYQYATSSDPYAWIHNYPYVNEALIDSMIDLVGPTTAAAQLAAYAGPNAPLTRQ